MVKAQVYHFLTRIKFIRQPKIMVQGIALSLYWWADLLFKFPAFWSANRKYQQQYKQVGIQELPADFSETTQPSEKAQVSKEHIS